MIDLTVTDDLSSTVEQLRRDNPLLDTATIAALVARQRYRTQGMGPVEPLFSDPEVGEIMMNGAGEIWVDRGGGPERSGIAITDDELGLLIERILDPLGLRLDRSSPFVDARMDDGSRVNIIVAPLALTGPVVTIRRFSEQVLPLGAFGGLSLQAVLHRLLAERASLLVVGATSSGKTSLLNALAALLDPAERIVTIEDTAELRLPGRHVVGLEGREANSEGVGEVTLRSLVRNALRMRPDRLIVGEVRGPEALDLIMALNTGHRGSLATCHAGSSDAGLQRLLALAMLGSVGLPALSLRQQLGSAIDVVVHIERFGAQRLVTEIVAVDDGPELETTPLWTLDPVAPGGGR